MMDSGGAPEFSGLVRLMQRPELVQRSEVAATELEAAEESREEDEDEEARGEMKRTPRLYL